MIIVLLELLEPKDDNVKKKKTKSAWKKRKISKSFPLRYPILNIGIWRRGLGRGNNTWWVWSIILFGGLE